MTDEKVIEQLCRMTEKIAQQAGAFIQEESGKIQQIEIHEKDLNSLVTYVDQEAEKMIVKGLSPLLPGASFLTEEETVSQEKADYQWIIDPLDGTTNFLFGIPVYAVSIALQHNGKTIIGVVHEVNRNETFSATTFSQTRLNGKKVNTSAKKNISTSLFATGFPYYDFSKTSNYLEILSTLVKGSRGVRRLGAAAVDLAYVACGRFDGFFEYSLQPWDVAAGAFLVEKAGGKVSDFSGKQDFIYGKEIIAANPFVFDELLKIVKEKMKGE